MDGFLYFATWKILPYLQLICVLLSLHFRHRQYFHPRDRPRYQYSIQVSNENRIPFAPRRLRETCFYQFLGLEPKVVRKPQDTSQVKREYSVRKSNKHRTKHTKSIFIPTSKCGKSLENGKTYLAPWCNSDAVDCGEVSQTSQLLTPSYRRRQSLTFTLMLCHACNDVNKKKLPNRKNMSLVQCSLLWH